MLFQMLKKIYLKTVGVSWLSLAIATGSLLSVSTVALPIIEPETFETHIDSFYFTTTSLTTIGYGDLSPKTTEGRLFTIGFLHFLGVGLFTTSIAKTIDGFLVYKRKKESGEIMYEGKNHIVIIDWSHKAQNAVKEILKNDKNVEIVVIDNMEKLENHSVHYIKGNATSREVLRNANIQEAKAVIIFSDDRIKDQMLSDGKSLMIATSVEGMASHVHTVVEIEREEHLENFRHINIDEFILSNETIARMAVKSII